MCVDVYRYGFYRRLRHPNLRVRNRCIGRKSGTWSIADVSQNETLHIHSVDAFECSPHRRSEQIIVDSLNQSWLQNHHIGMIQTTARILNRNINDLHLRSAPYLKSSREEKHHSTHHLRIKDKRIYSRPTAEAISQRSDNTEDRKSARLGEPTPVLRVADNGCFQTGSDSSSFPQQHR